MKILLTGHLGFIGRTLYDRLWLRGYNIQGLDLLEDLDITICPLEYNVDLVIHLAGKSGVRESINDPSAYWMNNVEGTKRIFNAFSGNTRILYASSSSAYEPALNPYAASKFLIDQIAPKNSVGMRFHTVYSNKPREGMFLDKLLNGTLEYVTKHSRDFIHIEDLCDAIELIIDNKKLSGILDIGTGESTKIQTLAPKLPLRLNTVHERMCTKADIKTLQDMDFKPKYSIKKFLTNNSLGTIL